MQHIADFFRELDRRWEQAERVRLPLIGCAALLLQTRYERGTKDNDVLETRELTPPIKERLLALGGSGSELHRRYRVHLELVSSGIPFLPQVPRFHSLAALNATLEHLDLEVLDVVDVVVAKLKRFG